VQLLRRHWVVKNAAQETVAEVGRWAKGVVGCTPILKPATCFSYYSGTDMDANGGSMEGAFEMAQLDAKGAPEKRFEVAIAPFHFIAPEA